MPEDMPEDMSDRMPEDLPVTKRIDVMVGITRSKVISIFFLVFQLSAAPIVRFYHRDGLKLGCCFTWSQWLGVPIFLRSDDSGRLLFFWNVCFRAVGVLAAQRVLFSSGIWNIFGTSVG